MSCSSTSTSPPPQEPDTDDPLCITTEDRRQFKESESIKRKSVTQVDSDGSIKKQKTDEIESKPICPFEKETDDLVEPNLRSTDDDEDEQSCEKLKLSPEIDVTEKLKMMDEITIKPLKKASKDQLDKQNEDLNDKVATDINKKDKKELNERKVQNLRKNIKDVLDESHLDATTLAAQRQESERLARVQEQQRLIRESQRQIAAEKQANKTQQKVLSILQGESSREQNSAFDDPILEKFALSSSMNVTPAAKAALQSIQSLISTDDQIPDSNDEDDDDDVVLQPDESLDKSKAVVVDSSSDSDDCIILSDEEEDEIEEDDDCNSGEHTNDVYNQRDGEGRVVVNVGHGESESNIYIAPQIARVIKPHQIGGVRFLFDNIIESIELFDKSSGFGCILAHSMGLGKTLQLVCFCDIFLTHTNSKSILIIMPINTLQNWLHEFNMWLPLPEDVSKSPLSNDGEVRPRQFKIFVLNDSHKTLNARAKTVIEWSKDGGVLMMGYEMYRLLSLKKMKQKKKKGSSFDMDNDISNEDQNMFDQINAALVNPGPDLVVCDEGHRIKNAHASTSLALKQIKSKRRVVLTGYPLQNNLLEYWCMVDFVRPSYLGTKTEFSNMFERPIQNGQCIDSTPQDCKLMRYRAHVLHSLLKGFVQRRSHTVLQKCLPEKTEFVLLVRMTPFQRKLYTVFMDEVVRSKKVPNPLKAFSVCCKIWNHPDVLYNFLKKRELDLEIELEESEAIGKAESAVAGSKKRGRKAKEPSKETKKIESKIEVRSFQENPVKTEAILRGNNTLGQAPGEPFKPPVTPLSNDSAYSSNQSTNSTFDSSAGGYNSYAGYEPNPYQNLNYNNGNGYQNWNGGGNFWQGNYYQSDYTQTYYQQPNAYQSYYGNSNYQSFEQKSKVESAGTKNEPENHHRSETKTAGGLLAEVIQEEAKEQRDKDKKEDVELKEAVVSKSSRDDGIPYDWAVDLMKDYVSDMLENSPKMEIFFCILEESIRVGDRLLVFSQSLLTLNLLERFLQKSKVPNSDTNWAKNFSYFRLDGSTAALEREKLINEFNINTKVKLFLVSTRAGSLGINLVGANRVVVFDASWNPCHDTQAVCRVYRYGQAKSCFVYRFVMDNCLEKKIYDRQINKQGMAERVVDECNPDANLSMREVTSLCYDDGDDPEVKDFSEGIDKYNDLVTKKILESYSKTLTKEPFQHESLLVDRKEKKLSQAEKRLAQRGYEMEKQAAAKPSFNYNSVGTNYRAYRTPDGIVHRPVASTRPLLNELDDTISTVRANNPRRWVPVDVWQKKGITAQEMTLPQDVSIQTNSADKSKIYLKAGQKVIVLKSPKGICLQLESGKVIAIRASMKSGQQVPGVEQKLSGFSALQDSSQNSKYRTNFQPRTDGDVIDISNDDDEEEGKLLEPKNVNIQQSSRDVSVKVHNGSSSVRPAEDPVYKEKVVYKPNLVHRKAKMPPPPVPSAQEPYTPKSFEPAYHPHHHQPPPKWDVRKNSAITVSTPAASNYNNATVDGVQKNKSVSFINPVENPPKTDELVCEQQTVDSSAFHPPAGGALINPYTAPTFSSPNSYQNTYPSNTNYPITPGSTSQNYQYRNSSFPNAHPSYHYPPPPPTTGNYDPSYSTYSAQQGGYGTVNYNQLPPTNSYSPAPNPDPLVHTPYGAPPSNYGQWNYNNN